MADTHAEGAIEGKDAQLAGHTALPGMGHPTRATLSHTTEQTAAIWAGEQLPLHAVDGPASSFDVLVPQPTAKLRATTEVKRGPRAKERGRGGFAITSQVRSIAFGINDVCRDGTLIVPPDVSRRLLASNGVSANA